MIKCDYYSRELANGVKIDVFYDECAPNPRTEYDGNLAQFFCLHSRYDLGDEHHYKSASDILTSLVAENCSDAEIFDYMKSNYGAELKKDEDGCEYLEWEDEDGIQHLDYDMTNIAPEIVDYFDDEEKWELLDDCDTLAVSPISIYDHSGVTIYLGSPRDRWDSGVVGIAIQTKDDTLKYMGDVTEDNWHIRACENMESEMKEYDSYVRGDCYGYKVSTPNDEDEDACWGYIGDEAIEEMVEELVKMYENEVYETEE